MLNPASTQPTETAAPFKVGLILDTNYPIGQIALTSIHLAIADFYTANANSTKHLVVVQHNSSSSDVLTAASSALELITRESVLAFLGPDSASEVEFVADLGMKANIPVISYSVTSQSVAPCCFPFFIRAAPTDALQVHAIAALVQEYGWRHVVPIYENDNHGEALLPFLVDALDNVEAAIPYRCGIRFSATDDHISSELYRLQTLQTRVFVIHTCVQLAVRIFIIANRIGMMSEGYVWILTEGLTSLLGWIDSELVQGVLGVSTQIPDSERLNGFKRRWTRQFLTENPDADPSRVSSELSNYAVWAYDAAWALVLATEHIGPVTNSTIRTSNGCHNLSTMVVSDTGKSLLQALFSVQFDGLGGKFQLVNGELNMTGACRIINVVDGKAHKIGIWTQNEGLKRCLRPVIWPGESMVVPKGRDVPTSDKRLRLAVPGAIDPGFQSFINLMVDKTTNRTLAKGFVFDMFEAAVRQLPYALLIDYIPIEHVNYDSLVELVANGSYDGIVADMTITVERSMSVDFTQPYKKSGISILAPAVTDKSSKGTWVFIKPLNPTLWVISAAFFIFTGIIIWLMEHPVNEEFRGPRSRHRGTIINFSFSTLAFSHTEKMVNNFSRVTLIVWLFVVFILTSSYTANLSSMLTVKQLKPSVSDINELKKSTASVGYLQRSFVKNKLLELGFDKSRLLPLKSPQEYADALESGSVAAIVDETPYLGVFINEHCDGYEMSSEICKTGGFGFAFPKGSVLAADLSRAILKITETDESSAIQQKWFDLDQNTCSSGDGSLSSKQLGLDSFEGLFCITGAISCLCCVIFLIKFYIQNKHKLRDIVAHNPLRTSLHEIWKLYYEVTDQVRSSSGASSELGERNGEETKLAALISKVVPLLYKSLFHSYWFYRICKNMRDPKTHQDTKKKHICFIFYIILFHMLNPASTQPTETAAPFKVGLILDTNYPIGQIALTSIHLAIADFYTANANSTKHLVVVQHNSSSSDVLTAASSALELIKGESVHAILGPDTASEVSFVAHLGTNANIPIISYSVTSQSVAPCCFPFFIRAAPTDALQVHAIAALVQEYGWRHVVPIYENDNHGEALLPFLVDALDNVEAAIPYRCGIRFSATDDHISSELYRLQTLQTRVFVIHTCVQLAVRIFIIANRIGMMSKGYVWILTEGLTSLLGWIDSELVQGVLGVSTQIPDSERLNGFKRRWTRQFLTENPDADPSRVSSELSNYAVWAYDAAWALVLATEHIGPVTNSTIRTSNGCHNLSTMVVSDTGKSLLQALFSVQFDGLGGKFQLVNGELNMTKACRVVNVVDGKAQKIGIWTQNEGLKRRLKPVIWPGESMVVPKGWDVPTSGKRLRLAVPGAIDPGFQSFINLMVDKTTNRTLAKGFVFDMFEAAVRQLPYALLIDYIPIEHVNYDSLVELVANGSYDGIVADMTITAERSMSVDFTQPYKLSGISIVAPAVKDKGSKSTWVFIKPLKPSLWVISAAFFYFTGVIIWIIEHRVNEEFRGPRSRHHGTIISFSFSTLAFSHSEKMVNNFSRVTLIVWLFVVFILTSSYTANLSSMLTVKQLKPSVSDINELKKSTASVGYLQRSFVKNKLLELGFDKSRLLPLKSPQEYADALESGSVAAIVDETPYLGVFINEHCDGYEMSSEICKTGGFGFAFPKGSVLAADLSRAILKITETDESSAIQQKWFDLDQNTCSSGDGSLSSKQLGLDSFEGLFCITGAISCLCCVIFLIKFYIQNKHKLRDIVAHNPLRTSLHEIWKLYYEVTDQVRSSSGASSELGESINLASN
ncbi:hypothetical protein FCM35_KLT16398 [Carex littledalei]|uniref:Ionotropic glutamate receptor C-terminal domain-containing protein n=1 Tax=Carex littledalei TaxID=544730 RepID=A0A833RCQ2_9POAL|nr:hypothetical protein FCM35_KLT16398 [Carex littledalei]